MKYHNQVVLISHHNHKRMLGDIRYLENNTRKPIVVFIHGFKGFKDWGTFNLIADQIAKAGFVVAKFNLSHNGTTVDSPMDYDDMEAFARNNFSIELDDIGVMLDYLQMDECEVEDGEMDINRIFVIGHSRGGGLGILKAAEDSRITGLITWAAISDLSKRWPAEVIQQWKKDGVLHIFNSRTKQDMPLNYQLVEDVQKNQSRLDIPKAATSLNIPWLICHGTEDETLPYSMALDLKSWNPKAELFMIDGATHTFGGAHPLPSSELPPDTVKLLEKSIEFLKNQH